MKRPAGAGRRRAGAGRAAAVLFALTGVLAPWAAADPQAIAVAVLGDLEDGQVSTGKGSWAPAAPGMDLYTGQTLRTGPDGTARVDFPWMSMSMGPATEWRIDSGFVLTTWLIRGRIELVSEHIDWVKVDTPEARVRGRGHAVLRRQAGVTLVTVLSGRLRIQAAGVSRTLLRGQGVRVEAGQAPQLPRPLPEPPRIISPGRDPVYARPGKPVTLTWDATAGRHVVRLLPLKEPHPVKQWETRRPPFSPRLSRPGTYRWQVATLDTDGLESLPSAAGLVCVLEP